MNNIDQELIKAEFNDETFVMCEYNKRRECDSFYIEQYNDMALRMHNVIEEIEKDRMEQFDDYVIYLLNKYLDMLKDKDDAVE